MSCRNNRSEILALHLVTWLPPSLAMQLHSSKQIISWQRLENGVEMSFLQDTASQVSPVGDKLEVGEMGHPNTLCFGSFNSRRKIQVIIRQPSPQWLSCRMFVSQEGLLPEENTPNCAISLFSRDQEPSSKGCWCHNSAWCRGSAASHTFPVAPFPAGPSQPQGHQCHGVWLSHLCSHADLPACEQTTT